jgi:hypothetical protein
MEQHPARPKLYRQALRQKLFALVKDYPEMTKPSIGFSLRGWPVARTDGTLIV